MKKKLTLVKNDVITSIKTKNLANTLKSLIFALLDKPSKILQGLRICYINLHAVFIQMSRICKCFKTFHIRGVEFIGLIKGSKFPIIATTCY